MKRQSIIRTENPAVPDSSGQLLYKQVYHHINGFKSLLLLFALVAFLPTISRAQNDDLFDDQSGVTVQSQVAPPQIPDYVQPPCPGDGYYWVPGYWAWATSGYYWVPGVWVLPPVAGLLWTPGYWGFYGGFYGWHPGYWGARVGYYGGINYGFGYFGTGFHGGRWNNGHFVYNTAVWHVGNNIHNTYVENVNIKNTNRTSFNGNGGIKYRPNHEERQAMRADRTPPGQQLMDHERNWSNERGQFHSPNSRPAIHSMSMPGGERFDARGHSMGGGAHGGRR